MNRLMLPFMRGQTQTRLGLSSLPCFDVILCVCRARAPLAGDGHSKETAGLEAFCHSSLGRPRFLLTSSHHGLCLRLTFSSPSRGGRRGAFVGTSLSIRGRQLFLPHRIFALDPLLGHWRASAPRSRALGAHTEPPLPRPLCHPPPPLTLPFRCLRGPHRWIPSSRRRSCQRPRYRAHDCVFFFSGVPNRSVARELFGRTTASTHQHTKMVSPAAEITGSFAGTLLLTISSLLLCFAMLLCIDRFILRLTDCSMLGTLFAMLDERCRWMRRNMASAGYAGLHLSPPFCRTRFRALVGYHP